MNDHEFAADAARRAGELLLALRAAGIADEKELRRRGDEESNELLLALLHEHRPGDAVLSEESKDDLTRLDAARTWIIDPLDGTREFGEPGRTDWAVHVALVEAETPTASAVGLPAQGVVLSTAEPAVVADRPAPGTPLRIVVSRTRPPALSAFLAERLGGELVPMGSAGAKAMSILQGAADVYAHGGGQYEWDSAAPVGVAASAGLHVSRLDGSALRYNQRDPYLPDLLVCRPEFAADVLAAIAAWPGE